MARSRHCSSTHLGPRRMCLYLAWLLSNVHVMNTNSAYSTWLIDIQQADTKPAGPDQATAQTYCDNSRFDFTNWYYWSLWWQHYLYWQQALAWSAASAGTNSIMEDGTSYLMDTHGGINGSNNNMDNSIKQQQQQQLLVPNSNQDNNNGLYTLDSSVVS